MLHYFDEDELLYFIPGDADDLARTIRALLDDPEAAAPRGERTQDRLKQLDWSAQRDTLFQAVEVLANPGALPIRARGRVGR